MGISSTSRPDFGAIKAAIHRKLIQRLNLERVTQMGREAVRPEVAQIVESLAAEENTPMTLQERERLSTEVLDEVFGLGPLEPLLRDPSISDILVNTYKSTYIERHGLLERTANPEVLAALAWNGAEVVRKHFEQSGQTRQLEDYYLEAIG